MKRNSSPLTVLHSTPLWLPQTETWIYNQVAEVQRLGLDTHVFCQRIDNLEQFRVANIHCIPPRDARHRSAAEQAVPMPSLLRLRNLARSRIASSHVGNLFDRCFGTFSPQPHSEDLLRVGRAIGANIVHSHFGNGGWEDLEAVRSLDAKHVVTFYGMDVNKLPRSPIWQRRYRELFSSVERVLCEGSHMARRIVDLGCPADKVKVQHLGVDIDRIDFRPRQWQAGEPLRVLIAASFREKKGIPYAIEALARLQKTTPIELTVIGDAGPEPEHRREKERILDALEFTGLGSRTRLLGYQPHAVMLKEAYAHHVFVQASVTARDGDTEGGAPVSITEMMASGMPIVSTRHCDIPEVAGPAFAHLLAPERDAAALADCLQRLIDAPQAWAALGRQGRERVECEYDKRRQGQRLIGHYEGALVS